MNRTLKVISHGLNIIILLILLVKKTSGSETCEATLSKEDCITADKPPNGSGSAVHKYGKEANTKWEHFKSEIQLALASYEPCPEGKCSCHYDLIKKDLSPFASGIQRQDVEDARSRGTLYQVYNHRLFRDKDCMFPSRCSGIEYFLLKIIKKLPDMELVINTRDWPQIPKHYSLKSPIFSFSKTEEYFDITYPAWTFWEGGPAISIYPTGLGRWGALRKVLMKEAEAWPWREKKDVAFFRGSRTSPDRDPLVFLSRDDPSLVDAEYTKNQAWKSDADTLYAPPASEVSLEAHCPFKYLFNYRGVAASFRLKHLFLCKSLVFHSGHDWIEFFYPQLKPWVHYIPVPATATQEDLRDLILFAREHDDLSQQIADRGFRFIRDHLRVKDVFCYWTKLLSSYAKLIRYPVTRREELIQIK